MMNTLKLATGCILFVSMAQPLDSRAQPRSPIVTFALEPQDLDRALTTVGRMTGREIIIAASATAGKRAPRLVGSWSADDAIRRLLDGSGLVAEFRDDVVLIKAAADGTSAVAPETDIVVTGTRIRGGSSPSPLKVLSARQIREAGQADLGEVARSLPQSFNGGQNPEVGIGVPGDNANVDASSSVNLRGLGADATLTLLNGHRLAYDGASQGVDISAIPLAAVDRVEVVPDGASALYGSDAVGGVVNVILARDFRGLATTARVDLPTGGGGTEQQYTVTAGDRWAGGGVLAAYSFDRNDAITAGQRDITAQLAPTTTLVRAQSLHSALVNLHQVLAPRVTFEIDGLYSARRSRGETPYSTDGTVRDFGNTSFSGTRSFSVAPRIVVDASSWQFTVQGLYARNTIRYETVGYLDGEAFARFAGCICNSLGAVEATAEGAIFQLPGGEARLALGGGVRRASLHYTQEGNLDFTRRRDTSFAYGELALPVVSPQNASPLLHQLLFSVAGRYERYGGTAGVLSPKVGIIYAPVAGVDLKGTWGRSFKAPTLYQQYSPGYLTVANAEDLGYTSYPANSTIGIINGGNAALEAERARTWSATLDLHPEAWDGARISVSYFDVDFTNRVQVPVQSLFGALGNPVYDPFIQYAPTTDQVGAVVAAASGGLDNQTGRAFDPSQLVAIVDAGNRNVTREHASGIDVAASYTSAPGGSRSLSLSLDASYLTSSRLLIPGLASLRLAGTVFNPPRFRARAGGAWTIPRLTLAGYVNFVGGVEDRRTGDAVRVRGQTTLDLTARFELAEKGWLRGTSLALAVRNALDSLPAPIGTGFAYATPYDSTNYSAVGRVIGVQLSRRW